MPTFPRRNGSSRVDPKGRLGVQTYSGLDHPEEMLVCATWANHVDLAVVAKVSSGVGLDQASVERLHNQLGEWLEHHREGNREKN